MDAPRLPRSLHVVLLYSLVALALFVAGGLEGCSSVSPGEFKSYHDARVLEADGQAQDNVALVQGTITPEAYTARAHQRVTATAQALPVGNPLLQLSPPPGAPTGGPGWLQLLVGSGVVSTVVAGAAYALRNLTSPNRTADDLARLQKNASVVAAMPAPLPQNTGPPGAQPAARAA